MSKIKRKWKTVEEIVQAPPAHFLPEQIEMIASVGRLVDTINKAMRGAVKAPPDQRAALLRYARSALALLQEVRRAHPYLKLRRLNAVERDLAMLETRAWHYLAARRS